MNYTITINDKSYVVLNCINPVEAVEKLTAEMNDNHLDIKIDMVEGDVIPVNTTSVHSTPVVEPAPAPEPETHHQLAVSNNVGKSNNLTTNYQPISTANNIPQAPKPEPVGYFNAPPVAPPPQRVISESQIIFKGKSAIGGIMPSQMSWYMLMGLNSSIPLTVSI